MLNSFPVSLIVGAVLGFLAGLGVGGGSLLILWLTGVLALPYPQARIINLLFFLPSAIAATLMRRKQTNIRFKKLLPAIIAGSISAILFYWLSRFVPVEFLKKLFGGLLVIIGIHELFAHSK